MQHWCWWNRNVANPIRSYGFQGKGRKALMTLKHEVLERTLLRRTKQQRADDLALPPRFTYLRRDVLDEVEEDFYSGLYTCAHPAAPRRTRLSWSSYPDSPAGKSMNLVAASGAVASFPAVSPRRRPPPAVPLRRPQAEPGAVQRVRPGGHRPQQLRPRALSPLLQLLPSAFGFFFSSPLLQDSAVE